MTALALFAFVLAPASTLAEPDVAEAARIHTGGETGAYHQSFCPPLAKALEKAGRTHVCTPSSGSLDNMARIEASPTDIAFAQLDVLSLARSVASVKPGKPRASGSRRASGRQRGVNAFQTIRSGDVHECLFAVARNPELKTFGDIAARAEQLRFILPPENSGSAATFRYLQSIDADLAHAGDVRHVADTDEAIRLALSSDDTVTMFVQFADPDNPRFQLINRLEGHFVPVIDRNILAATIDGQSVYAAQETEVTDARWTEKGVRLVTACTPLVVFTGSDQRIAKADAKAAAAHVETIRLIRAMPAEALRPSGGFFASILKRSREISAGAVDKLVGVSQAARAKAKPLLDKAKEATSKALEGAKPHVDKAKETGAETLEKAKETVKELIEPAHPHTPPGQKP